MIQIVNNMIIIFCFVMIISSYKNKINKVSYIALYSSLLISNLLIIYFIYPNFEKCGYILIKVIANYILLKLIYKERANVIDIFYIMYLFLIYQVLKFSIPNIFIETIIIIVLSILCKIYQDKLKKLSGKIISMWKGKDDKSLTLRCIFVITFNISFYIICKII